MQMETHKLDICWEKKNPEKINNLYYGNIDNKF